MFIRAPKDFWAGLMFLAFAALAIVTASGYSMGRGGRMGPGYFPTLLGWALAFLGVILVVRSLAFRGEAVERIQPRPLAGPGLQRARLRRRDPAARPCRSR